MILLYDFSSTRGLLTCLLTAMAETVFNEDAGVFHYEEAGGAGFGGKAPKTPDEQVDALLQLYERCRSVVAK